MPARGYACRVADEDPGVLGNLPRSRPGRRSDKRGGAGGKNASTAKPVPRAKSSTAAGTRKKASAPKAAGTARAKTARPAGRATQAPRSAAPRERTPPPAQQQPGGSDPVGEAIRVAGKIAEAGLKTAGGLLKRLPRP